MSPPRDTPTAELERLAEETQQALNGLNTELKCRREALQHGAIDHLQEHLAEAKLSLKSLKNFFEIVADELRGHDDKTD